jgi:hypothetical protein
VEEMTMAKCFVKKCENTATARGEIYGKQFEICDDHFDECFHTTAAIETRLLEVVNDGIMKIRNLDA